MVLSSAAHPLIGIDPEIRAGRPCVAGTHIGVRDILNRLDSGWSVVDIMEDFPELTVATIAAAQAYAADHKTPYAEVFGRQPDFRVTYRIFTAEEGGRKTSAHQGIRWDIRYEGAGPHNWLVYPEFIDPDGFLIPNGPFAPVGRANMFALNANWLDFHRPLIQPGVRGYFMEGGHRVGVWEVAEVLGLRQPAA